LLADGLAAEGGVVFGVDLELQFGFLFGGSAVDFGFEEAEDFRAALGGPLFGGCDVGAVGGDEGIGELVGRDFGFVEVCFFYGEGWG